MDTTKPKRRMGRPPGRRYETRLMLYLDDRRNEILEARSEARGLSKAEIVRNLLDEAAPRWRQDEAA